MSISLDQSNSLSVSGWTLKQDDSSPLGYRWVEGEEGDSREIQIPISDYLCADFINKTSSQGYLLVQFYYNYHPVNLEDFMYTRQIYTCSGNGVWNGCDFIFNHKGGDDKIALTIRILVEFLFSITTLPEPVQGRAELQEGIFNSTNFDRDFNHWKCTKFVELLLGVNLHPSITSKSTDDDIRTLLDTN